jgi:hypothetical protein
MLLRGAGAARWSAGGGSDGRVLEEGEGDCVQGAVRRGRSCAVLRVTVKATIGAALAYFVLPFDAVPDVLVGLGYADDAAVIAGAVTAAGTAISDEHRNAARRALQ